MSEEAAEAAAPPAAPDAGAPQGPNLAIYKSPELIESVVVFDPIGGRNLRFLDTMKIGAIGGTRPAMYTNDEAADFSKYAGWMPQGGFSAEDGSAHLVTDQKVIEVCADISNQGGTTTRNLSAAATTPIQFRFDGIPLVLPRESYFEITLEFVYVGPSFNIGQSGARNFIMGLLKSQGWARTASGLIQLVQAVDISATSFQTPDMTTQTFLEAVQTKDVEIDLRPDFYFNSYASFQKLTTEQKLKCTTVVSYINRFGNPKVISTQNEMMDFYGPDTAAVHVEPFSMPVTFRIPFAAISPVFKTNVLPLFMTNSTSINIQCQLQNPNIPFPLHSVMGDNPDMTPFIRTRDGLNTSKLGTEIGGQIGNAQLTLPSYEQQNQIDRFLAVISRAENARDWYPDSLYDTWGFTPTKVSYQGQGNPSVDRPGGLWPLPASGFIQPGPTYRSEYGTQQLLSQTYMAVTGNPYDATAPAMAFIDYSQQATGPISPLGELQYCFWGAEFTMKAFVKTYASALNNPLVARYLRPYLVGPEGQPAFFRSAYLSYNFNAQTYTIPPGSSVPFNFNISQTLINVPMAFLMFAEINGEKPYVTSQIAGACTMPESGGNPSLAPSVLKADGSELEVGKTYDTDAVTDDTVNTFIVGAGKPTVVGATTPTWNYLTEKYGLLDVFHRSHYVIQSDLDIHTVQVSIGPSGWNLYQRPLDMTAMNEITLNTLTRYDPEMVWKERVYSQTRFYTGDAWACFDLSHDEYRGLFIDSDNMLNITGMFTNKNTTNSKIVYVQLVLPYIDHFIINTQDSTVTKSQL